MGFIDYQLLYKLQDDVLERIFEVENEFYLTGGTCLSRFYQAKRYSDDLDFFTNDSVRYGFAVKKIKRELQKHFDLVAEVESKDFSRYRINDLLQIDFVNDRVPRYKDVIITEKNYIIDNVENILSNKITAIMGRDNPKDIFDIYLIDQFYAFSWSEIIASAKEKAAFSLDDLVVRLKSFPKNELAKIQLIDHHFLDTFATDFPMIIKEIAEVT
jgi:predicted nucleotidyltransferase component of viral defense system